MKRKKNVNLDDEPMESQYIFYLLLFLLDIFYNKRLKKEKKKAVMMV